MQVGSCEGGRGGIRCSQVIHGWEVLFPGLWELGLLEQEHLLVCLLGICLVVVLLRAVWPLLICRGLKEPRSSAECYLLVHLQCQGSCLPALLKSFLAARFCLCRPSEALFSHLRALRCWFSFLFACCDWGSHPPLMLLWGGVCASGICFLSMLHQLKEQVGKDSPHQPCLKLKGEHLKLCFTWPAALLSVWRGWGSIEDTLAKAWLTTTCTSSVPTLHPSQK